MRYRPHQSFIAPAAARPELWRVVACTGLMLVAGLALFQLTYVIVSNLIGPEATQALADATTFDRDSSAATLYALFVFGFFGVGLAMALHGLHGRSLRTLLGPWEAVLSDFLRVVIAVSALSLGLFVLLPQDYELLRNPNLARGAWLSLLPLALFAILVQSATEELFFRGFLQQQLAVRFPALPVWLVVPAVLFGLLHLSPGLAGGNAVYVALWATAFGLAAADLTARTGALGAAIGLHMANNMFAILVVSLAGPGSGLALFHLPLQMDDPRFAVIMVPDFAMILCSWLAARLALKV